MYTTVLKIEIWRWIQRPRQLGETLKDEKNHYQFALFFSIKFGCIYFYPNPLFWKSEKQAYILFEVEIHIFILI